MMDKSQQLENAMNSQPTIRAIQRQVGLSNAVVVACLERKGVVFPRGKRTIKVTSVPA
jgi:hypothetical protein